MCFTLSSKSQFWSRILATNGVCYLRSLGSAMSPYSPLIFRIFHPVIFQIDLQYLGLNYDTLSYWMLMVPIWWGETYNHLAFLTECCVGEVAAAMDYFRDFREKDLLWKPGVWHTRHMPSPTWLVVHEHFLKTWQTCATQNRFVLTMSWHFLHMIFSKACVVEFFHCLYVASVGGLRGKNHHTVRVFSDRPFWHHTLFPSQKNNWPYRCDWFSLCLNHS